MRQTVPRRNILRRWPNELPKKIGFALHVGFKEVQYLLETLSIMGKFAKQRILPLACMMWNLTIHYMEILLPCLCLCSFGRFSLSFSHIYSVPKKLSDVPCNCFTKMIAHHFKAYFLADNLIVNYLLYFIYKVINRKKVLTLE